MRTLYTLTTYYWLLDDEFQKKLLQLDSEFLEIQSSCEPSKQDLISGMTADGEPLIDYAVYIGREKFQLLMIVITKANKNFAAEDEV